MMRPFRGDESENSYHVLRKLQQNSRANIPGMLAQRAMSTFTLQAEQRPKEATATVHVMVYPHNPFVGKPEVRRMLAQDIQPGMFNARVQINDSREVVAEPDEDGDYLYWPGTPEFDQVNALYYTTFALRMYERLAQRSIAWSFPNPRITVNPHVGNKANAFYNEQERLLGFHTFKTASGAERSTAESADIVTHEAAHAILDGMRDLWNESFGLGPRAFHESFGDLTAMLVALQDDALIHTLLKLTDGNLRKTSFITEVAERLVDELRATDDARREDTLYLRNAFNMLSLQAFDDLEYMPRNPDTTLSRQEHNYSRVFTGAVYDILVGIYENMLEQGKPPFVALFRAAEVVGHMLVAAIELGPVGEFDFADMAKAMLTADAVVRNSRNRDVMMSVFNDRKIIDWDASDAHVYRMANLPEIELPKTINNAMDAFFFLERDVLPTLKLEIADELLPMSTYRNASGQAFMTFFSTKTIKLEGVQYQTYNGTEIDLFGGLTLMFDKSNRLRSYFYRPVKAEDIRQVKTLVAEIIAYRRIAHNLLPADQISEPHPEGLLVPGTQPISPGAKLVTYPAIVDNLPEQLTSFRDYLHQVRSKH